LSHTVGLCPCSFSKYITISTNNDRKVKWLCWAQKVVLVNLMANGLEDYAKASSRLQGQGQPFKAKAKDFQSQGQGQKFWP